MSLLNTKPRYFPTAVPTESGWTNPVTGEVLISIGGLKGKLEAEALANPVEVVVEVSAPVVEVSVEVPEVSVIETKEKEIVMEPVVQKQRKEYTKKPKVIGEVTEHKLDSGKQLIGEIVEYDLDKPVIGE